MGMVLNSKGQLRQWTMQCQDKYFVDKSEILEKLKNRNWIVTYDNVNAIKSI